MLRLHDSQLDHRWRSLCNAPTHARVQQTTLGQQARGALASGVRALSSLVQESQNTKLAHTLDLDLPPSVFGLMSRVCSHAGLFSLKRRAA
mmetsp:Transcript_1470/g.3297  ORF Transcript_1470/g.3297 Transcript_1470/m.3297 type:complete len:91 (+) Transcript_1470:29-301(+)